MARLYEGSGAFILLLALLSLGFQQDPERRVMMTVEGPVAIDQTGMTLSHEHILVDWIGADSTGYHRWDRDEVVARALPFLEEVRDLGVRTVLECTPAYLGRDPYVLQRLARETGMYILTNTGYYGAVDNRFMPEHARHETAEEIADRWIEEFHSGIDGSGIRPGFIKISVAEDPDLSDLHRKIVRAAALTSRETGLTIVSHTASGPAHAQLEILGTEGVPPSAFVWTHAQRGPLDRLLDAADAGAWIALDNVHHTGDDDGSEGGVAWYADRIAAMRDAGHLDRLLISHDAGWYDVGQENGGEYRGYTDIFVYLLPALQERGFTDEEVRRLLVENPRKAFAIRER